MLITLLGPDFFEKQRRVRQLLSGVAVRIAGEDGVTPWIEHIGQASLFGEALPILGSNLFGGLSADERKRLAEHLLGSGVVAAAQQVVVLVDEEQLPAKDALAAVLTQGTLERFTQPSQAQLVRWVIAEAGQLGVQLDRAVAPQLVEVMGGDKFALASELAKWAAAGQSRLGQEVLATMVPMGGDIQVFGMVEAWAHRRLSEALAQLQQLWRQRQEVQVILSLLERQLRLMYVLLVTQEAGRERQILAQGFKLQPFVLQKVAGAAKKWQPGELMQALDGLYRLDLAIKSGRQPEAQLGVELWVVESLGGLALSIKH